MRERAALDDLRDGDPARAVHTLTTHGRITTTDTLPQLRDRPVDHWWHVTRTHGTQAGVMIALRVADVDALNHLARRRLADAGMLTGPAITAAHRTFQTGDRVVARRNRRQPTPDGATVPVMNGQRGTITTTNPTTRTVTVQWDGGCATIVSAGYLDAGKPRPRLRHHPYYAGVDACHVAPRGEPRWPGGPPPDLAVRWSVSHEPLHTEDPTSTSTIPGSEGDPATQPDRVQPELSLKVNA